jgi:hypothetical protein
LPIQNQKSEEQTKSFPTRKDGDGITIHAELKMHLSFKICVEQYVRGLDVSMDNAPWAIMMEILKSFCYS